MGMEQLTGKDNKKARNAKSREVADMKKTEDFTDAERVLAGKEPLSEKWKSGEVKVEKKEEIVLENVVKDAYVAPKSIAPKKEKKEKKEEISGDAKEDKKKAKDKGPKGDPEEIKKLTQEIEDYKLKLKTEFGYTKNDIAKDEDILEMQKRLKAMGH